MDNPAYESGDESTNQKKYEQDPELTLNANDLTISSGGSSGISTSTLTTSGSKRVTPNSDPTEPVSHIMQSTNPILVDRRILLTKEFYPISKYARHSSVSFDTDESQPDMLQQSKWDKLTNSVKKHMPWNKKTKSKSHQEESSSSCSPCSLLFTIFPILKWLSNYSLRDNLLYDVIAGCTILALHIPQGLAYGRLAGAEPINGLYVSLFPVVIYAIFGGSRQISIGTFAVISIACRDVLEQVVGGGDIVDGDEDLENETLPNNLSDPASYLYKMAAVEFAEAGEKITSIEILTSLCLLVGLIQFLIGLLRLGVLATLLSDPIISSFCVAAAVHVFTSQVFGLFGIDSAAGKNEPNIPFEIVRSWYRFFTRINTTNLPTLGISVGTMAILYSCKTYLEPFLMKRFRLKSISIPIDILSIVFLTAISYAIDLNGRVGVQLIPKIDAGFEGMPVVPRIDLWPRLYTSAILLAFICYAGTYSLQKMYARKNGYEVYPNQELFAMGMANMVSSFFLCYPCAGSLARSAVQDKVGGRTQLASLISSALIFIFIMFLSSFLATLPKCALSCIIIVALISTFKKCTEFNHYWKISKLDGIVWIATFFLVVFIGVDRGLLFGLAVGLALMIFRLAIPELNLKYHVPNTECYLADIKSNPLATFKSSTPGIIIFEFHGPLIFINVERFKKRFAELVLKKIREQIHENQLHAQFNLYPSPTANSGQSKLISAINLAAAGLSASDAEKAEVKKPETIAHTVIFDMSQVSYIDGKAVEALLEIEAELKSLEPTPRSIRLFLSNTSPPVLDTMMVCHFFHKFDYKRVFITVHDAVQSANGCHSSSRISSRKGSIVEKL